MNQEFASIAVIPVGNGVYRVFSLYEKESVAFTAYGLLELAAWIASSTETLEAETEQEQQRQPTIERCST